MREANKTDRNYCFEVVAKSDRTFLISAETEEERMSWMKVIQDQCNIVNSVIDTIRF